MKISKLLFILVFAIGILLSAKMAFALPEYTLLMNFSVDSPQGYDMVNISEAGCIPGYDGTYAKLTRTADDECSFFGNLTFDETNKLKIRFKVTTTANADYPIFAMGSSTGSHPYVSNGYGFSIHDADLEYISFDNGDTTKSGTSVLLTNTLYDVEIMYNSTNQSNDIFQYQTGAARPSIATYSPSNPVLDNNGDYFAIELSGDGAATPTMFIDSIWIVTAEDLINYSNVQPDNLLIKTIDVDLNATLNTSYPVNCSAILNGNTIETREYFPGTDQFINFTTTQANGGNNTFSILCGGLNISSSTGTQYFYVPVIDNCSTYTTRAIEFDLEYYDNSSDINGTMAGFFKVFNSDYQILSSTNLTWQGDRSNYSICVFPPYGNYSIYGQMEYDTDVSNYLGGTYYFANVTLDNVTDTVKLYYQNGTTLVTFTVLDENDDPQSDVLIKVLAYDLTTDSYNVVDILQTDDLGVAVGNIILNTQWYKFILERDGALLFESDPTIITLTSKTFRITLGTNAFDDYTTARGVTGDVTFTNATQTFSFTYSDLSNSVTRACLKVTRRSMNGDTVLSDACQSSAAGTINYAITETVWGNKYIAVGYITIEGNEYPIDVEEANFDYKYRAFGQAGIFAAFLLILTLVMIGVSSQSPAISVLMLMVGIAGSILMTIFYLSWITIIIVMIMGGVVLYKITR